MVGKRETLKLMMAAFLSAGGHILLEDFPGLAKTLIANSFAMALGMNFKGSNSRPIFYRATSPAVTYSTATRIVFNCARDPSSPTFPGGRNQSRSPKTQSALLEAMQEYQVTLEGETLACPSRSSSLPRKIQSNMRVLSLAEAQLDRFMIKLSVGYPTLDEEDEILKRRSERRKDLVSLQAVITRKSSYPCAKP